MPAKHSALKHLKAYIQCNIEKNALGGMVLNIINTNTSQPENDPNIISRLSKACWIT